MTSHKKDNAVLDAIFNPLLPSYGGEVPEEQEEVEVEQVTQQNNQVQEDTTSSSTITEEEKQAKQLEIQGVQSAEAGDIDGALDFFNRAVVLTPSNASCYNNRAQALRLKGDVAGALQDLNSAIDISHGVGKAACQAYTQRALIQRLEGDSDAALEDFKMAANLGSEFAKTQVVLLNPYAAMCNQMLSEVIGKMRAGECTD